jgi:hypothetical protein
MIQGWPEPVLVVHFPSSFCIPWRGVLRPSTHKGGDLSAPGGTNQQYLGLEKLWCMLALGAKHYRNRELQ